MGTTDEKHTKEVEESNDSKEQTEDFIQRGYKILVDATKKSNVLPKGRDYDFYNTHESYRQMMGVESNRLLSLMDKILSFNEIEGNMSRPSLEKKNDLLAETNDVILDRAAVYVDQLKGFQNLPSEPVIQTVSATVNGSWNTIKNVAISKNISTHAKDAINLLTAKNILRPQKFFKDTIDNSSDNLWMPRIKDKPNSLKPLALYVDPAEKEGEFDEFCHPYEYELDKFTVSSEFLQVNDPPPRPKPIAETPLVEVDDEGSLNSLLEDLRGCKMFGVDLEHHSYRTFLGITCLMQISTAEKDYLVDTLALRDKLYILNEVFTKPSILKIFHGADSDIPWLQRDLSIYVVNMFDTHQAAKLLNYTGLSLAYLLQRFCNFLPNKKFQLADWRIRPLPQELKDYAREDTHYLIYIYEMLKIELAKKGNEENNLMEFAFKESTEVCKKKYVKPRLTETSHLNLYRRRKVAFDNRQMYALKEIYAWRDTIAREEDESVGYVLPNHMMLQIAETLPREVQGIFACCNFVPPLVRSHCTDLHKIVLKAREQSLEKVLMPEVDRRIATKESVKLNIDSPLNCPHDLTKYEEFKDNLPTLLDRKRRSIDTSNDHTVIPLEKELFCSVFEEKAKQAVAKIADLVFLGPYDRYKLVRPFIKAEADQEKPSTEDASIEDRIASLHEHFVKEQKKYSAAESGAIDKKLPESVGKSTQDKGNLYLNEPLVQMPGGRKRKREEKDNGSDSTQVSHTGDEPPKRKHFPKPQYDNRRGRGNSNRRNERSDNRQERPFQPFDYSTVDFGQFSGGGKRVHQNNVDTKFKSRGNKSRAHARGRGGQRNNKSVTFRNFKRQ